MVVIRAATVEDVPQIVLNSKTADRFRMSEFIHEVDEEELHFWVSDPRSIVIVSTLASKLIGYAYGFIISPKWFFFDAFLVIPEFQNKGIGKKMYGYLRKECKRRGLQLIQGLVKETDNSSLNYWIARGFEDGCKCIWVEDWLDED